MKFVLIMLTMLVAVPHPKVAPPVVKVGDFAHVGPQMDGTSHDFPGVGTCNNPRLERLGIANDHCYLHESDILEVVAISADLTTVQVRVVAIGDASRFCHCTTSCSFTMETKDFLSGEAAYLEIMARRAEQAKRLDDFKKRTERPR